MPAKARLRALHQQVQLSAMLCWRVGAGNGGQSPCPQPRPTGKHLGHVRRGRGSIRRPGSGGVGKDDFIAPHGIAVDSRGDIYVGEVCRIQWSVINPGQPVPDDLRALRKIRRIAPSMAVDA